MENKPLISIVLPLYNAEKYIEETLISILNQTYQNFELLIINDASTDKSLDIVKEYSEKYSNIKIVNLRENSGVSNARNTGIANSKGEYVAFIDSDDIWKENKLELQIEYMIKNDILFSFTSYEMKFCNSDKPNKIISVPKKINYEELLKGNPIACFTVICKKEVLNKTRFANVKHEDYVMWLSIAKKIPLYGLNENLGIYRKHENSISSNKFKSASWVWNIYRNVEKLDLFNSIKFFSYYIIKAIFKHIL